MANRIFELPETKGSFQVKGIVNGVEKNNFYTAKKTSTNKDFRAINFGCEYDGNKSVYLNLNGMPQQNVYFYKKDNPTKPIPWANRNVFNEDGYRMIGVNLGIVKTVDEDGKPVNDRKVMHQFDACEYIKDNLKDDVSVFVKGDIDFSSYFDREGNIRRSVKYVPGQISLCKDVDFEDYNDDNKPTHDFTQTILFMEIDKEKENDKDTGRFIVSAKIVTWSDIVDTQFIITDTKLAGLFKKNLKPYNAITVHGKIEVSHTAVQESLDDGWGEANAMTSVYAPTKTEMVITGATPSTIDKDTYNEKNIIDAIKKIRNSKKADQNFGEKASEDTGFEDDWGSDDEVVDVPWD